MERWRPATTAAPETEHEELAQRRAVEERHIDSVPDDEREEVRNNFHTKGFEGCPLERAVAVITGDRKRWVDTMLAEEYGLPQVGAGAAQGRRQHLSRVLPVRGDPLLPFLPSPVSWWRSGAETLLIGLGAAALVDLVGALLRSAV